MVTLVIMNQTIMIVKYIYINYNNLYKLLL